MLFVPLLRKANAFRRYSAPGNAGIAAIAECVAIVPEDIGGLASFASTAAVDLTFVGGETPLALGIVDEFASRGLRIIGPTKAAAQLEASKSFAKDFMSRHGVPTAKYVAATPPALPYSNSKAAISATRTGRSW